MELNSVTCFVAPSATSSSLRKFSPQSGLRSLIGSKQLACSQVPAKSKVDGQQISAVYTPATEVDVIVDGTKKLSVKKDENLRFALQQNKVDLYTLKGKLTNCGGYGKCGTCVVEVFAGMDNLSPLTPDEKRILKEKSKTLGLACQAVLRGPVSIKTKPK
eukprot:EC124218.1.p1 GENE.EC124218.1~~EC124218.1.p1  ORF type:complete len:160 (+),score=10.41 EC124218.1:114-593(+)